MSNKVYDILKWIALVFLPAIGLFYGTIGSIWAFPKITEIVATLAAIEVLLGMLLQISSSSYNKK